MSKTDELKKLSEKLVGSAPDTRRASDVVEYMADQLSGNSENTETISDSIAYLTKYVGNGGSEDMQIYIDAITFDMSQSTKTTEAEYDLYEITDNALMNKFLSICGDSSGESSWEYTGKINPIYLVKLPNETIPITLSYISLDEEDTTITYYNGQKLDTLGDIFFSRTSKQSEYNTLKLYLLKY